MCPWTVPEVVNTHGMYCNSLPDSYESCTTPPTILTEYTAVLSGCLLNELSLGRDVDSSLSVINNDKTVCNNVLH